MPRRLILFFDGTWNKVHSRTNVERLWRSVAEVGTDGSEQLTRYVAGVGVKRGLEHLLGGAFGLGLSDNVKTGFQWLSELWRTGDEIWIFGFSRGAYTARSLGGLIRKCGLLNADAQGKVTPAAIKQAYKLYSNELHPNDPQVVAFRKEHSREAPIRFIGVWDTVGSLGVPGLAAWFPYSRSNYRFHDTELSKIVQYAYQALALDEHRADFAPTKWTRPAHTLRAGESKTDWKPQQIEVEQRWFVGAHADVGGGEPADGAGHSPNTLPQLPLAWLQAKAADAGLVFKERYLPPPDAALAVPNDSYAQFMYGLYKYFKPPYERVIGGGVNETIDASVWRKWSEQAQYRSPVVETALASGCVQEGGLDVA